MYKSSQSIYDRLYIVIQNMIQFLKGKRDDRLRKLIIFVKLLSKKRENSLMVNNKLKNNVIGKHLDELNHSSKSTKTKQ